MAPSRRTLKTFVKQLVVADEYNGLGNLLICFEAVASKPDQLAKLFKDVGDLVVEAAAIDGLVKMLNSTNPDHKTRAISVTGALFMSETFTEAVLDHGGVLPAIMRLLEDSATAHHSGASAAIFNISKTTAGAKAAAAAGAIPRLVKLANTNSSNRVLRACSQALYRLTHYSANRAKAAVSAGLLLTLPKVITSTTSDEVLEPAVDALYAAMEAVPMSKLPEDQAILCSQAILHHLEVSTKQEDLQLAIRGVDGMFTNGPWLMPHEIQEHLCTEVDLLAQILGRSSTNPRTAELAIVVLCNVALIGPTMAATVGAAGGHEEAVRWQRRADATPVAKQAAARLVSVLDKFRDALEDAGSAVLGEGGFVERLEALMSSNLSVEEVAAKLVAAREAAMGAFPAVVEAAVPAAEADGPACAACGAATKPGGGELSRCSACKRVSYCGAACQRKHWKTHKPHCRRQETAPLSGVEVRYG